MSAADTTIRAKKGGDPPEATTSRRPRPRRIGFGSAGMSMTPEEFDAIPYEHCDDRFRYELIRGVLIVTPIPSGEAASPNDELGYMLRVHRDTHPQGARLDSTLPERYVLGTANRRRGDRLIWIGLGRTPDEARDVPAVVVEFVSGSRRDALRDYEEKRDEYLTAGVREYWIIDRFRPIMTVYRPTVTGPTFDVVAEGQTYQTDLLPGFELPLARLLAQANAWAKPKKRQRPRKEEGTP